jgi:Rieske Fe-S protein
MSEEKRRTLPPHGAPMGRRGLLLRIGIALNVVGALRRRSYQAWISLGSIEQFPEGETRLATYENPFRVPWDGVTAKVPCWVRRVTADTFQVFAINCAHLGCPVRWFPESQLFLCPCHGGAYYADGSRASGPPPRGLFEYEYQLRGSELWVRGGQTPTLATSV